MAFHCVRCKREIDKTYMACPHCGEPVTDFLRRYAEEPVDGKYQIVERLGAGGMGEVYKVNHTYLGATRVIKVIRPQISESKDAHERFLREARAATKIQHPNVGTLHDFSALPDGSHYMVWEFIDGENVAQRIRARGKLQPRYAVRLIIQALHGLDAIHRAGIVHRDISPENLMITREEPERVKVIDLGVAKMDEPGDSATRVGVFVGKLRYASPEHLGFLAEGEKIDGRADLFSIAMVLYEMLTGRPPFEATSPHEYVLLHSREQQFKPLDLPPDLPGGAQLQAVLAKALDRDRNKRYATAREFAAALEEVERSLPDPNVMKTMHIQTSDMEATWTPTPLPELDMLRRSTVRTEAREEAPPTIRTPLPPLASTGTVSGQAGATLQTPLPPMAAAPDAAHAPVVARTRHGSFAAFAVIAVILLLAGGAIAFLFLPRGEVTRTATTDPRPPIAGDSRPEPTPAEAKVDVVTTPAQVPLATQTTVVEIPATTTHTMASTSPMLSSPTTATSSPAQVPVQTKSRTKTRVTPALPADAQPAPVVPVPIPVPQPPAPAIRTYVDGDTGDADVNDQLLADLRRQLTGVKTIAVRGSGDMAAELARRISADHGIAISDTADTVIEFNGTLERLGRGRKKRAATAIIRKNGRVIFRYEMPPEEYRVGDTPTEAFSRVISDAFGH